MAMLPMAMFGLEVPAGDVAVPAIPDIPSAFRITMAAIDPSVEPEGDEGAVPRATLKIIRQPLGDDDSEDDEDFDVDGTDIEFGESDEDEEEDAVDGPSDPSRSKKAQRQAAEREIRKLIEAEEMDVDAKAKAVNGVNGVTKSPKAKGKMPASDEDEDESESDIEDDMDGEVEEFVICTLDPSKNYQQPLDLTLGEDERVWFKVSGTHSIHLTGNYVQPVHDQSEMFDPDSDEEDEYDLSPNEDELDGLDDDESVDELDDMEDPRITEMDDEEEVPALVKAASKKVDAKKAVPNKNKRPAAESDDDEEAVAGVESLDAMMAKEAEKVAPAVNGQANLSKKQLKKLKKNNGEAATAPVAPEVEKKEAEAPSSAKSEKKVAFAKELEQGPTPTKDTTADKSKPTLGVKTIQGITVDDRKLGAGQAAKNGDRVGLRYIGKLTNHKVFDSNKKGKPFSFKLGAGEVIKGWEIGVRGMQAGGERRITIPPHLAYGSQKTGEIPANSTLIFDIKLVDIGKK